MKRLILLSMAAASLMCAEDDLVKALEETTQVATKTRINADYVPGTVNIIKGEELKALGIINLAQPNALDMIVGMDSSVNALRGSGAVYGGQGVKIKWLLNGRAVSSQIWSGSTWARSIIGFPILTDQIDRIEIIRGPDSAIYGGNAIFGVINIITKKDSSSISLSGSYNGDGNNGRFATANISHKQDSFEISASASVYGDDGYSMYVNTPGNFHSWVNGAQYPGYGPGNLQNGSAGYSIFVDAKYGDNKVWANKLKKSFAQGAFGTWYPTDPLPQNSNKLDGSETFEQIGYARDFSVAGVDAELKIGHETTENKIDNFLRLGKDFGIGSFDAIRSFKYKEERKYISLDFDKKYEEHHFVFGLFGQKTVNTEDKRYGNYDFNWAVPTTVQTPLIYVGEATESEGTKRWERALFFQDTWELFDRATLTYGARYDKFSGDIKSNGWSPRVAIVYRANENHILKAQYARAFRPPTYAEVGGVTSSVRSETVDTVELGHIYKSNRTTLKTTLFESKIYDMITFNDITYDTENLSGKGIVRGVEAEYKYEGDSFRFGANQAFYDTKSADRAYISPYNLKAYNFSSQTFVLAPSMMTNIFLTLNQNGSYPTTFWYHYMGSKKRKSEFATVDAGYQYMAGSNGDIPAQDYLNITQQFKGIAKNMDLSMGVQNVFGKTLKTLYMPLNQPNNQDIPYMKQSFWVNLSYKF